MVKQKIQKISYILFKNHLLSCNINSNAYMSTLQLFSQFILKILKLLEYYKTVIEYNKVNHLLIKYSKKYTSLFF